MKTKTGQGRLNWFNFSFRIRMLISILAIYIFISRNCIKTYHSCNLFNDINFSFYIWSIGWRCACPIFPCMCMLKTKCIQNTINICTIDFNSHNQIQFRSSQSNFVCCDYFRVFVHHIRDQFTPS